MYDFENDPKDTDGCINAGDCWNVDEKNPVKVCMGSACGDYLESSEHRRKNKRMREAELAHAGQH